MINNITIMGRLTAAPEMRTTQIGTNCASFTVAVERSVKGKDGNRQTDFIPCVAWRSTAEFICKYFGKGRMIAVTGELQSRKFTDKNGNNRTALEVVANNVSFCGDSSNNSNNSSGSVNAAATATGEFQPMDDYDEDLPF